MTDAITVREAIALITERSGYAIKKNQVCELARKGIIKGKKVTNTMWLLDASSVLKYASNRPRRGPKTKD